MTTDLAKFEHSLRVFEGSADVAKALMAGMGITAKSHYEVMAAINWGGSIGLQPAEAAANIYIIKGKPVMSATLMGSLVKRSGKYNYRIQEHTNEVCRIAFYEKWDGKWEEIGVSEFSIDDAKRAGLDKSNPNWEKYRKTMLRARAMSQGVKWYCPDVLGGSAYVEEEAKEIASFPIIDAQIVEVEPVKSTQPQTIDQRNRMVEEAQRVFGAEEWPEKLEEFVTSNGINPEDMTRAETSMVIEALGKME